MSCGGPYFGRAFVSDFTSGIKMGAAVSPETLVTIYNKGNARKIDNFVTNGTNLAICI